MKKKLFQSMLFVVDICQKLKKCLLNYDENKGCESNLHGIEDYFIFKV